MENFLTEIKSEKEIFEEYDDTEGNWKKWNKVKSTTVIKYIYITVKMSEEI